MTSRPARCFGSPKTPAHYNTAIAGEGPQATPTIFENKVYALGAEGI